VRAAAARRVVASDAFLVDAVVVTTWVAVSAPSGRGVGPVYVVWLVELTLCAELNALTAVAIAANGKNEKLFREPRPTASFPVQVIAIGGPGFSFGSMHSANMASASTCVVPRAIRRKLLLAFSCTAL
jgi:membrane-associated phospholipid phosphatase